MMESFPSDDYDRREDDNQHVSNTRHEDDEEDPVAAHSGEMTIQNQQQTRQRQRSTKLLRFVVGVVLVAAVIALVTVLSLSLATKYSSTSSSKSTTSNVNSSAFSGSTDTPLSSSDAPSSRFFIDSSAIPSVENVTVSPSTMPSMTPNSFNNIFDSPTTIPSSISPSLSTSNNTTTIILSPVATITSRPSTVSPTISPTLTLIVDFTKQASFELLETLPHDSSAFTQGLEVLSWQRLQYNSITNTNASTNNATITTNLAEYMLESTGNYGASTLRIVEIATGQILEQLDVDSQYFAEGCTYYQIPSAIDNNTTTKLRIVQLTWQSGKGLVYSLDIFDSTFITFDLQLEGTFDIRTTTGEGWGIVYHPPIDQFIVTDGSANLHFWELRRPSNNNNDGRNNVIGFELVKTLPVTRRFSTNEAWTQVVRLNEIEWDPYAYGGSTVLANVWQTNEIVRIRLDDGLVTHQYNMASLDRPLQADVLNGIAAVWEGSSDWVSMEDDDDNNNQNHFWITGKYWPQMYRVRLLD